MSSTSTTTDNSEAGVLESKVKESTKKSEDAPPQAAQATLPSGASKDSSGASGGAKEKTGRICSKDVQHFLLINEPYSAF